MTTEDILVLAKAGFNANQIAALRRTVSRENSFASETNTEKVSENKVEREASDGMLASIQNQLAELSQRMTATNIMDSSQPRVETADDVLASIINPKGMEV